MTPTVHISYQEALDARLGKLIVNGQVPGRRLRLFARIVSCPKNYPGWGNPAPPHETFNLQIGGTSIAQLDHIPTLGEALEIARDERARPACQILLSNRSSTATLAYNMSQLQRQGSNMDLVAALQDLADELAVDLHEACNAFDNPGYYFPGVDDERIPPVPDEHVDLVMAAWQRELNRELRNRHGQNMPPRLPAVPLNELPRTIQRALAERRRLRYFQWGINAAAWEAGTFNLWDIEEGQDYYPRLAVLKDVTTFTAGQEPDPEFMGYYGV